MEKSRLLRGKRNAPPTMIISITAPVSRPFPPIVLPSLSYKRSVLQWKRLRAAYFFPSSTRSLHIDMGKSKKTRALTVD
ncbi:unnamed protein product [Trichogramma brassicae]|uniref:Uncharacterized protein n=1 Tax=Trichogramma brassicae TaxID=86971 RepID=A0A6H5IXX0_9HYME|nr:unnamed protein product [Trichogramma brassicae]